MSLILCCNFRAMKNETTFKNDKANVIIFPPLLFVCTIALSVAIGYIFPVALLPFSIALIAGIFLLIIAIMILRRSVKALANHKTTVNPSGATTAIVTSGIYKHTRNPIYISFTLIYISVLVMTNAWWGFLLLIPLLIIVQKGIVEREEKYLIQKFGDQYLKYKNKVKRWL